MEAHLENVIAGVIVSENKKSFSKSGDLMIRELLIDKRTCQSFEIFQIQICDIDGDFIFD